MGSLGALGPVWAQRWHGTPAPAQAAVCAVLTARESPASAGVGVCLEVALAGSLTAAIGRDLHQEWPMKPVDLRLDVGGRVDILMAEHGEEIRQETEDDPDRPRLGDPRGFQAVMAELGQRGEDGFTRGEVLQGLGGREGNGKGVERGEGLARLCLVFQGGQQLGHLGVQVVVWGVQLGREEGDERATGPHRVGEGERMKDRMIAEDLLEHGIGPGFCGIQEGHSTFRGGQGDAARTPSPVDLRT